MRTIIFIPCYGSTETAIVAKKKEDFYSCFANIMTSTNRGAIMTSIGDFKALLDLDSITRESTMGKHAMGRQTANGELITELYYSTKHG